MGPLDIERSQLGPLVACPTSLLDRATISVGGILEKADRRLPDGVISITTIPCVRFV
jgi:hypothetical protein